MPGRRGYEVCEAISADPALRHIPVLLRTGTFEPFDEERATRCGAAGHIAKPFEAQTLLDEVQRLFALAASRRPAPAAAPPARPLAEPPLPAAAPPPPRVAARPTAKAAESFDFFDDEIDDLLPAELAEDASFGSSHEVDLDSAETPFAFGEAEAALPPPAHRTVASQGAEAAGAPVELGPQRAAGAR